MVNFESKVTLTEGWECFGIELDRAMIRFGIRPWHSTSSIFTVPKSMTKMNQNQMSDLIHNSYSQIKASGLVWAHCPFAAMGCEL